MKTAQVMGFVATFTLSNVGPAPEAPNPKPETRNPKEARNPNAEPGFPLGLSTLSSPHCTGP